MSEPITVTRMQYCSRRAVWKSTGPRGAVNFLRSRLGWLLVALYVAVVVATYQDALAKRGTWLYDIGLNS